MSAVVLLITVATGIYATINLGTAENKLIAKDLVEDKVGQFYDKDLQDACLNPVYDFTPLDILNADPKGLRL